jgi:FkbM family methyltransferase
MVAGETTATKPCMTPDFRRIARTLLPPRVVHAYRMLRHTVLTPFERELTLVPRFISPESVAVDVGANVGLYTAVMARHAGRVLAFEPHPGCAAHLRAVRIARCEVIEAAVSDRDGEARLRVPYEGGAEVHALGTLAEQNTLAERNGVRSLTVATARLDSALAARLRPGETVGFVKIDVEGHERAVVEGAAATIERHQPVLLIEIEIRHGSDIEGLFAWLAAWGYRAHALVGEAPLAPIDAGALRFLQSAEPLTHDRVRAKGSRYVNNVLFLPEAAGVGGR